MSLRNIRQTSEIGTSRADGRRVRAFDFFSSQTKTLMTVLLVTLFAALTRPGTVSGGATFIPEARLGSCGNGAGATSCVWDCSRPFEENPGCRCIGGTNDGELCYEANDCPGGGCPICKIDASHAAHTFAGRLYVQIDDDSCGFGGVRVTVGLRGRKADGTEFSVFHNQLYNRDHGTTCLPDDEFSCFYGCDYSCDTCVPSDCDYCDDEFPSCPPEIDSLCNGQVTSPCDQSDNGNARLDETLLTEFDYWLHAGKQPLLEVFRDELTSPSGPYPGVNGSLIITDAECDSLVNNSGNSNASSIECCINAWFLRESRPHGVRDYVMEFLYDAVAVSQEVTDMSMCEHFCGDRIAEPGESCPTPSPSCGNGTCDTAAGEDDITCGRDCGCLSGPQFSCVVDPAPTGCRCDFDCSTRGDCCQDACYCHGGSLDAFCAPPFGDTTCFAHRCAPDLTGPAGCADDYPLADDTPCNDANLCTQLDECDDSRCVGKDPVTCTESRLCVPATGTCSASSVPGDCNCNGTLDAGDPVCAILRLVGAYEPDSCLEIP